MADYQHLCLGCMAKKGTESVCPHCGWIEGTPAEAPQHLPPGTILNEKYLLGRVLGHGGFGITYLAYDLNLDMKLALKEYMPRDFATRSPEQTMVSVFTGGLETHFENGLKSFLDEAKTLAQFNNHPGIVGVRDFFRENGTAYLVMYYLEGIDFKQYLQSQGGKIPYQTSLMIMLPVMDALREVHRTGTLHRDISPDNIYITSEGQVKVLDFGSARHAMSEFSKSISVILKPGFAPEEQYRTKGKQGPWTDVYATAATFYRAMVGHVPPESLDRLEEDTLIPPSQLGIDIPADAEAALMKALSIKASDRYQTMEEFQQKLLNNMNEHPQSTPVPTGNDMKYLEKKYTPLKTSEKKAGSKWIWIGGGVVAAIFLTIGIIGITSLFNSKVGDEPTKPIKNPPVVEKKHDPPVKEVIKEITVPNLVNSSIEDAKSLLQEEGLKLGNVTYVDSLYIRKGFITSQSVKAEEMIKETDEINLEVSKGIELPLDEESIKSQHLKAVYEYWDKGYALHQQKNYLEALKSYLQARQMAEVIYEMDGNFDAQYSMGVLDRNVSLVKRILGYHEYALVDIENSVVILEDLLTKDPVFQKDFAELANSYGDLSYIQFVNALPNEAVASAEKAIQLDSKKIIFKANLANAYLFTNQFDSAVALYTLHKDEKINDTQLFKDVILADFTYFRKLNLTHPDMEKIEEMYKNNETKTYTDKEEIEITLYANALAFEDENVAGYLSTIDPNSSVYDTTEKALNEFFTAYDHIKLVYESIEVLEIKETSAKVKVVQNLSYTAGSQNKTQKSTLIHTFVRSDGTYKWLFTLTEEVGG
ncbi:protein kinase domain-containing protein [Ferdinandcohnia quinoae]|uniref:non-specific serine/threonine protein kinase n=1 Tax=Fredinandcohnia quinoae TaxID=2918902 RepID=A0AAW5E060_9BACI|nr:protein kinase [Fredinandcohnia sp. SECRCQ15]MCH1625693.1 protein kinase [Fredinandcohnia sp. SECRCQ15]